MTKKSSKKNSSSSKKSDALNANNNQDDPNKKMTYSQNQYNPNYNPQTRLASMPVINQDNGALNALIQYRDTMSFYIQQYYATQAYMASQAQYFLNPYIPSQIIYPYISNHIHPNNLNQISYTSIQGNPVSYNNKMMYPNQQNYTTNEEELEYFVSDNDPSGGLVFHPSHSFSKFLKKKQISEWKKEIKERKEKAKMAKKSKIKTYEKKEKKDKMEQMEQMEQSERKDIANILKPKEIEIKSEYSQQSNLDADQSIIISASLLNIDAHTEQKIEKKLLASNWYGVLKKCLKYNPINRSDYWQQFFIQNRIFPMMEKADFNVKSGIIGFFLGQKFHAAFLLKESLKEKCYERTFLWIAILKSMINKVPFEIYQSMYSSDLKEDIPREPEEVLIITKLLSSIRKTRSTVSEKSLKEQTLKIFKLIVANKEVELFRNLSTYNKKMLCAVANEYYLTYGFTICDHIGENSNLSECIKAYVKHTIPIFINEKNYIVQLFRKSSIKEGHPFFFWQMLIHILEDKKFDVISGYEDFFRESILAGIKSKVPIFLWKLMLKYIKFYIPEYSEKRK